MIEALALFIVLASAIFLLALGGLALVAPRHARRFLLAFAGSPRKHYTELALRLLVGGAFVLAAPRLPQPGVFALFGWVMLATTAGLLLVPWRWHQRFARHAVPRALNFLPFIGVASLLAGGLILLALLAAIPGHAA